MQMVQVTLTNVEITYEDFFEVKTNERGPRKSWRDEMQPIESNREIEPEERVEEPKDLFGAEEQEPETETKFSTFEKQQRKMDETIKKLESENMAQKEWVMKGEVSSKARPMNSLLEQDLDVDIAVKPVPVITEETTKTLADLVIQRIKDNAYDDVVRKAPPKDSVYDPNRRWELDDEKNKKSLAEIYEEEYQKKVMQTEVKSARSLEVEREHEEIETLMSSLFNDLDALSNWHFTPKPSTLELTVVPNASVPAISMEEVIPAHVSAAKLAVPKEVYDGKVAKSQNELDSSEKAKLRTKAKRKIFEERKDRERAKKLRAGPGELQREITKSNAIKKLMGQKNVTLVVDSKDKKALGSGAASVIEKGGKIGKDKKVFKPEMLKL